MPNNNKIPPTLIIITDQTLHLKDSEIHNRKKK